MRETLDELAMAGRVVGEVAFPDSACSGVHGDIERLGAGPYFPRLAIFTLAITGLGFFAIIGVSQVVPQLEPASRNVLALAELAHVSRSLWRLLLLLILLLGVVAEIVHRARRDSPD